MRGDKHVYQNIYKRDFVFEPRAREKECITHVVSEHTKDNCPGSKISFKKTKESKK